SNPNKAFHDSIQVTTTGNDPRTILESVEMLDKVSQDKAMEIYKERFANPADFTFAFVGNIDPNNKEIQKLLATYLGSLKTNKKNTEKFDNVYREFPKGKIDNYFTQKMKTKKASNRIYYTADMPFNITNQVTVSAISDILDIRYLESIREKEGGSYGVGVYGGASNVPKDQAIIIMQFDTDPEKQVKLMGIIHDELTNIISKGPLKEDLEKVKENLMKQYKQDLEQNSWWSSKLKVYYQDGLNYRTDYKSAVDALTSESIQKTLKSIADQKNVIEIVMKPAAE
ncbi:MAG: peptidase domain protein, partial [Bacteroidetes bacterium]|nr:peptidase domain protein [Bacteroidota bacterium]